MDMDKLNQWMTRLANLSATGSGSDPHNYLISLEFRSKNGRFLALIGPFWYRNRTLGSVGVS